MPVIAALSVLLASIPMTSLVNLFHHPKRCFAGCLDKESVGATLLCFNDVAIPTKAASWDQHCNSEKLQANLTVIGIVNAGFSKVPYSNVNNKTVMGENPKPLAEFRRVINEEGSTVLDLNTLDCYGFLLKKGKPKDKGRRIDGSDATINNGNAVGYSLMVGDVHRFYGTKQSAMGGSDREKRENLLPSDVDVIPAFSRLIVKCAGKGWNAEKVKLSISYCFQIFNCRFLIADF